MSLNGLAEPAITEAHDRVLENGQSGWFFVHYVSRDTVELLAVGDGGLAEARTVAVKACESNPQPVFGLVLYRGVKVLVKCLPDNVSRLVQARATVHFTEVIEQFSHDTVVNLSSPTDLVDAVIAPACSLQPEESGQADSPAETAADQLDPSPIAGLTKPADRTFGEDRADPVGSPAGPPASLPLPASVPAAISTVTPADPKGSPTASSTVAPPRQPTLDSVSPSQPAEGSKPNLSDLTFTDLYDALKPKPKPKLVPRPALDSRQRPSTPGARQVAALPANLARPPAQQQQARAGAARSGSRPRSRGQDSVRSSRSGQSALAGRPTHIGADTPAESPTIVLSSTRDSISTVRPDSRLNASAVAAESADLYGYTNTLAFPGPADSSSLYANGPVTPTSATSLTVTSNRLSMAMSDGAVTPEKDRLMRALKQYKLQQSQDDVVGPPVPAVVAAEHFSDSAIADSDYPSPVRHDTDRFSAVDPLGVATPTTLRPLSGFVGDDGSVKSEENGVDAEEIDFADFPPDKVAQQDTEVELEPPVVAQLPAQASPAREPVAQRPPELADDPDQAAVDVGTVMDSVAEPPRSPPVQLDERDDTLANRRSEPTWDQTDSSGEPTDSTIVPLAPDLLPSTSAAAVEEEERKKKREKEEEPATATPIAARADPKPDSDPDLSLGLIPDTTLDSSLVASAEPGRSDERQNRFSIESTRIAVGQPISVIRPQVSTSTSSSVAGSLSRNASNRSLVDPLAMSVRSVSTPIDKYAIAFPDPSRAFRSVSSNSSRPGSSYSMQSTTPTSNVFAKRTNVSSGISQRIQRLAENSTSAGGYEASPYARAGSGLGIRPSRFGQNMDTIKSQVSTVTSRQKSILDSLAAAGPVENRSRSSLSMHSYVSDRTKTGFPPLMLTQAGLPATSLSRTSSTASTSMPPPPFIPHFPQRTGSTTSVSPMISQLSTVSQPSPDIGPGVQPASSVSVTATIVRDPNTSWKPDSADSTFELLESPLLVERKLSIAESIPPTPDADRSSMTITAEPVAEPASWNSQSQMSRYSEGQHSPNMTAMSNLSSTPGRRNRPLSLIDPVVRRPSVTGPVSSRLGPAGSHGSVGSFSSMSAGTAIPGGATASSVISSGTTSTGSTRTSRTDKLRQRVSITMGSVGLKSLSGLISPSGKKNKALPGTAGSSSSPAQPSGQVQTMQAMGADVVPAAPAGPNGSDLAMLEENFLGDVNVQFPDSLLWKRRYLTISATGDLIISFSRPTQPLGPSVSALSGSGAHGGRPPSSASIGGLSGSTRTYHVSVFRQPYIPDRDCEELPHSVMLDFYDGRSLQCACEGTESQKHVLSALNDAWRMWGANPAIVGEEVRLGQMMSEQVLMGTGSGW